jgi:hypothetical protein
MLAFINQVESTANNEFAVRLDEHRVHLKGLDPVGNSKGGGCQVPTPVGMALEAEYGSIRITGGRRAKPRNDPAPIGLQRQDFHLEVIRTENRVQGNRARAGRVQDQLQGPAAFHQPVIENGNFNLRRRLERGKVHRAGLGKIIQPGQAVPSCVMKWTDKGWERSPDLDKPIAALPCPFPSFFHRIYVKDWQGSRV